MKCYFITGVSSGIGEALVKELLSGSEQVLIKGCSRRVLDIKDARYVHYTSDLSSLADRKRLAKDFFQNIPTKVSSLVLINNAGFLGTIGSVGHIPEDTYDAVFSTNLIAPAFLCDEFIRRFQALPLLSKQILNISSGAAKKDYAGWAAYCASKAGLDRFSSVVNLEQQSQRFPIHIQSFAPGVIDTPMQGLIRLSNEKDFPSVSRFWDLHEKGDLVKPEIIAQEIVQMVSK